MLHRGDYIIIFVISAAVMILFVNRNKHKQVNSFSNFSSTTEKDTFRAKNPPFRFLIYFYVPNESNDTRVINTIPTFHESKSVQLGT